MENKKVYLFKVVSFYPDTKGMSVYVPKTLLC